MFLIAFILLYTFVEEVLNNSNNSRMRSGIFKLNMIKWRFGFFKIYLGIFYVV